MSLVRYILFIEPPKFVKWSCIFLMKFMYCNVKCMLMYWTSYMYKMKFDSFKFLWWILQTHLHDYLTFSSFALFISSTSVSCRGMLQWVNHCPHLPHHIHRWDELHFKGRQWWYRDVEICYRWWNRHEDNKTTYKVETSDTSK